MVNANSSNESINTVKMLNSNQHYSKHKTLPSSLRESDDLMGRCVRKSCVTRAEHTETRESSVVRRSGMGVAILSKQEVDGRPPDPCVLHL